jgi:hypothetical protein
MSPDLGQSLLVTAGSACFALLVLTLARRGLLTVRYTVGWLGVAGCVLALVFVSGLLRPLAAAIGITPTGILLALASSILLMITLQITVTLSALREAIQTLAESQALLEERVARLECSESEAMPR